MTTINNQVSTSEQKYKKPGVGAIIGGVLVGSAVQGVIRGSNEVISPVIMKKMAEMNKGITEDEFTTVESAIKETIKDSRLGEKGVDIIKATPEKMDEISNIMFKEMDNITTKYIPEPVRKFLANIISSTVKNGENAFFAPKAQKIVRPEKELELTIFHEIGHALNKNFGKIGKVMQKCRGLAMLSAPISLIALWKTKKAPNEEPKSNTGKVTTFIKENAGKLTFITFLPILLDEGLASIKGGKFATKLLSPELAKKVSKSNALGFSTYLGLATLSSLGIYLGTKVKDAIAKPKLITKNEVK